VEKSTSVFSNFKHAFQLLKMIKVLYIPLLAVASGLLIVVLQKLVIQHAPIACLKGYL